MSHKLHRQNHENLESRIDSRRKKISRSKDPKRYFPRICSITLTIHNCYDATYSENALPDTNLVDRRKKPIL